ncbi:MAG: hypothetical protein ACP5NV_03815, partial [Candidatus Woesearchaeota archaeon]
MKSIALILLILMSVLFSFTLLADVLAADGFAAYRSVSGNGLNYPKIRFWNSTGIGAWGSEIELPTAGSAIRQAMVKTSPVSSKTVVITSAGDAFLDGYVCVSDCNNPASWTVYNNFATSITSTQRRFDFEFESSTGDLVLVYAITNADVSRDLAYRVLNVDEINLSNTVEQYINDVVQTNDITYTWVAVDRNPISSSEEIALIGFDLTSTDINTWIWNGTDWGNNINISETATATGNFEALAIRYNNNGSKAMAIGGDGVNGFFNWRYWDGASWSTSQTFDSDTGDANDIDWISLKPNPITLDFQAVIVDSGADLSTQYYNDSSNSWTRTQNIDTGLDIASRRSADFSWFANGTSGLLVWET